jgi:hypothetical protein
MSRSAQIWIGEPFGPSAGSVGVDASVRVRSIHIKKFRFHAPSRTGAEALMRP